jgi:hypothetical protein
MLEGVNRIAPFESVALLVIFMAIMVGINYDVIRDFRSNLAGRRKRRKRG